jgi:hypothetical protein
MLTEDQTRSAFAQLRAAEIASVSAPGTAAAHRTVRRRRAARVATVAGCVAAVLAGGVALANNLTGGGANSQPADPQAVDVVRLGRLANAALTAAEPERTTRQIFGGSGPLDSAIHDVDETGGSLPAYQVLVTCMGEGSMNVTLTVGTNSASDGVACGRTQAGAAGVATLISVPTPAGASEVSVTLEPDEAALHHAGYAFVVMKP